MLATKERLIEETDESLKKPHEEIFYRYSYMMSQDTVKIVQDLFKDLCIKAIEEHNNQLNEDDKPNLFGLLNETRKNLHEERTKIEDYISSNYHFPEKENN